MLIHLVFLGKNACDVEWMCHVLYCACFSCLYTSTWYTRCIFKQNKVYDVLVLTSKLAVMGTVMVGSTMQIKWFYPTGTAYSQKSCTTARLSAAQLEHIQTVCRDRKSPHLLIWLYLKSICMLLERSGNCDIHFFS